MNDDHSEEGKDEVNPIKRRTTRTI
jgi:hypothetical protein